MFRMRNVYGIRVPGAASANMNGGSTIAGDSMYRKPVSIINARLTRQPCPARLSQGWKRDLSVLRELGGEPLDRYSLLLHLALFLRYAPSQIRSIREDSKWVSEVLRGGQRWHR